MSNNIALSIIVPVYNAKNHIDNCIKNLLNQDFDETFEIIMIDDGSSDNSFNIIQNLKITNLKLFRLIKNSGVSAARNKGLDESSGEYVYFMDVDDSIDKDALKNLYSIAKKIIATSFFQILKEYWVQKIKEIKFLITIMIKYLIKMNFYKICRKK